jgi:hypothetical protein
VVADAVSALTTSAAASNSHLLSDGALANPKYVRQQQAHSGPMMLFSVLDVIVPLIAKKVQTKSASTCAVGYALTSFAGYACSQQTTIDTLTHKTHRGRQNVITLATEILA